MPNVTRIFVSSYTAIFKTTTYKNEREPVMNNPWMAAFGVFAQQLFVIPVLVGVYDF